MTDRPVAADRTVHDLRHLRGWFALAVVAILLLSIVAGPWAVGSGAQSGPATPGTPSISLTQTGPAPGTPRAPVRIRTSSSPHAEIVSINGTPQATATLPTEPRQGTAVPLPPLYRTANGSATVPESTTGHELRLYRLTIVPGATFDLPESSGWTLLGAARHGRNLLVLQRHTGG